MDINKQEFMFMKHNAPDRCEPSIEVIVKIGVRPEGKGLVGSKVGGRGWCEAKKGIRVRLGGGQGGCEPRIELIVKCTK